MFQSFKRVCDASYAAFLPSPCHFQHKARYLCMQLNPPSESLDSFFSSDDQVMAIRGPWGVGKTYLWDAYIQNRISRCDLSQAAYSYVSLFGKSSLLDVRASIFQSAKQISTFEKTEKNYDQHFDNRAGLFTCVPWVGDASDRLKEERRPMAWLTSLARSIPPPSKHGGIIESLQYKLVRDYIVCFDGLEHKNSSLSVGDVMSLAEELARHKGCKVVLIFNHNSFTEEIDKQQFEAYREKVVDVLYDFAPSHGENLSCVFDAADPIFPKLERLAIALNLKNIRVIKKLKKLIDTFLPALEMADELILDDFLNHATMLCWSYFLRGEALPYEFVRSRLEENSWAFFFGKKEDELTPEEKRYREITSIMQLSPSIFDDYIATFLESGYSNIRLLRLDVAELVGKADVRHAHEELNCIWKRYINTFSDNQEKLVASLRESLFRNVDKIGVSEYCVALEWLADFGEDVSIYIDRYINFHGQNLARLGRHDLLLTRRVTYKPLMDRIRLIQASHSYLDIDQVAMRIVVNRSWTSEDIDFLASLSSEDFVNWLRSEPVDLPVKLKRGLLIFAELQGNSSHDSIKYRRIYRSVRIALSEIGASCSLNQRRLKNLYGIDVEVT